MEGTTMKKSKLIIIVAIVALLVVGGAYAAWTSRTTVSVNASSGEMDVAISATSVGKVSEYVVFAKNNITVSEDKKAATVSIANLYPGAEANATITITNTGTIPVKLSGCTQERISAVDTKTNKELSATDAGMLIVKYNATAVTKTGQVKASDSSSSKTATLFSNANMVIEAGATVTFDMQIMLDKNAADSTEKALYTFKFTPMFVQAN
jgi:predicted ribosomally synthesized peptide with SipW-like signal peptide